MRARVCVYAMRVHSVAMIDLVEIVDKLEYSLFSMIFIGCT